MSTTTKRSDYCQKFFGHVRFERIRCREKQGSNLLLAVGRVHSCTDQCGSQRTPNIQELLQKKEI